MGVNYRYHVHFRVLANQLKHVAYNVAGERNPISDFLPRKHVKLHFNDIRVVSVGNLSSVLCEKILWSGDFAGTEAENRGRYHISVWNVFPLELLNLDFLWRQLPVEHMVCMVLRAQPRLMDTFTSITWNTFTFRREILMKKLILHKTVQLGLNC